MAIELVSGGLLGEVLLEHGRPVDPADLTLVLDENRGVRAPPELGTEGDLQALEGFLAGELGAQRRLAVVDVDVLPVVGVAVEAEEIPSYCQCRWPVR